MKKILSIILIIATVLSLASCGNEAMLPEEIIEPVAEPTIEEPILLQCGRKM